MEGEARDRAQSRFHVTYIGQAQPVEVYFAVYDGTLQAEALSLVGRKLRAALLVEGELPQEGLATQDLDDGDLMLTLAKRLAAGERAESQALEALFADSRALETVAGNSLDGAARAGCKDLDRDGNLPIPPTSATAPSVAPKQQLALPILLLPPPRSEETTARGEGHPAWTPTPIQHRFTPTVPASEGAFIPSAGTVVPLTGWHDLTAPPAPPRRRKQPARDQLKLFG